MIFYNNGGIWHLLKLCQLRGSVFPRSTAVAFPCAVIAAILRFAINEGRLFLFETEDSILSETQAWAGFSFLVGFLIVFRTSQAYSRFWEGCTSTHRMNAEWFDACSALVSFCKHSKVEQEKIMNFKHTLVRLFSMLHASALADLDMNSSNRSRGCEKAFKYQLIDPNGIDADSLEVLRVSDSRTELLFQWIQTLIVEQIETGVLSIPPPILSRAFQEIGNGMSAYHDAVKVSYIPFPFPYAQNCDFLLVLHWLLIPFVLTQWVANPVWAFFFVFMQVFVLWSLNFIAAEIENPFGSDKNDLDGEGMQHDMNRRLLLLIRTTTAKTPKLSGEAVWATDPAVELLPRLSERRMSFLDVWSNQGSRAPSPTRRDGRAESFRSGSVMSIASRASRQTHVSSWDPPENSEDRAARQFAIVVGGPGSVGGATSTQRSLSSELLTLQRGRSGAPSSRVAAEGPPLPQPQAQPQRSIETIEVQSATSAVNGEDTSFTSDSGQPGQEGPRSGRPPPVREGSPDVPGACARVLNFDPCLPAARGAEGGLAAGGQQVGPSAAAARGSRADGSQGPPLEVS